MEMRRATYLESDAWALWFTIIFLTNKDYFSVFK